MKSDIKRFIYSGAAVLVASSVWAVNASFQIEPEKIYPGQTLRVQIDSNEAPPESIHWGDRIVPFYKGPTGAKRALVPVPLSQRDPLFCDGL